jgi:hypothetical protein
MINRIILLAFFLSSGITGAQQEISVWAVGSGSNKVYHCPRSRWYHLGEGREISECQAIREGYKPAVGNSCGSQCQKY